MDSLRRDSLVTTINTKPFDFDKIDSNEPDGKKDTFFKSPVKQVKLNDKKLTNGSILKFL